MGKVWHVLVEQRYGWGGNNKLNLGEKEWALWIRFI
jgi:hypothetical protein